MKTSTADLIGRPLDWAVLTGRYQDVLGCTRQEASQQAVLAVRAGLSPSTMQPNGDSLIDELRIDHQKVEGGRFLAWPGRAGLPDVFGAGPTALVAAMRCYALCKLGADIEAPADVC